MSQRTTRSNSAGEVTVDVLKSMMSETKNEIMACVRNKTDEVNANMTRMMETIKELEKVIFNLKEVQAIQQVEIETLKHSSLSAFSMEDLANEVEQRQNRSKNVIIFGLQEISSGTIRDKRNHDTDQVKKIATTLGVGDVEVHSCSRIGRLRNDGPRLLKVRFSNTDVRTEILRHSRNLKGSKFDRVFIKPDLTPFQQKRDAELQAQLRDRRDKGEDVVIYKGKIQERTKLRNFRH